MNDFLLILFIIFGFVVSNLFLIQRMERGRQRERTDANRRLDDVADRAAETARLLATYHVQLQASANMVADKLKATDTLTADKLQAADLGVADRLHAADANVAGKLHAADASVAGKLQRSDTAVTGGQEQAASLADLAALTALASKVRVDEIYELVKKLVPSETDPPATP